MEHRLRCLREFQEQQRQFNVGEESSRFFQGANLSLQERMFQAEQKAAKPNFMDTLMGIGGLLPGVGSVFQGVGALRNSGLFGGETKQQEDLTSGGVFGFGGGE